MRTSRTKQPQTLLSSCVPLMMGVWLSGSALAAQPETPWTPEAETSGPQDMTRTLAVGQCPAEQGESPVYLPDSERCDWFYECAFGTAQGPFECPAGTLFDAKSGYCAPVWWVRCMQRP
jgi:hypothetical protein